MRANSDMATGQADQVDLYYRHSFISGVYFESFTQEESGFEPESAEISKKNQGGLSNLGYKYLKMDYYLVWSILGSLNLFLDE